MDTNIEKIQAPHSLAEIVKGTTAEFSHYKGGQLFYSVEVEGYKYEFPIDLIDKKNKTKLFEIPIEDFVHQVELQLENVMSLSEDVGETTFERTYKAITLMRYIRKAITNDVLRWDKI